jgi:two-component system chemotaxis sensor kinase CheA
VVLQADQQQFGLVVDEVRDTEEIVVKPLGKELKGLDAFAGATIMGDGRVALILDVLGIAERASIHADGSSSPFVADAGDDENAEHNEKQSLLLFEAAEDTRMAVALSLVARLEELDPATIEWTAGQMVVQYRGAILPIIDLSERYGRGSREVTGPVDVIVCADESRAVGLIVREIIDTVEEVVSVRETASRPGTRGAAVIQGRVTDLLDLEAVLSRIDPSLCERKEAV